MQTTALGFLMFQLTHSAVYLGATGFITGIAAWLFTLYAGTVADRFDRRKILLGTQIAAMLIAAILAYLTLSHLVKPWHILTFAFLLGTVNAFDGPARHSFVSELVMPENLTNAIALNSMMFNTGIALGPSISGILYAELGPGWCFGINAASYLAVIASLLMIRTSATRKSRHVEGGPIKAIVEGVRFAYRSKVVAPILMMVAVTSVFGMSIFSLMPAWTVNVLHGSARTNGLMMSARGIGALIGAFFAASLSRGTKRGPIIRIASLVFPVTLLAFAFSRGTFLPVFVLVTTGCALIIVNNLANSTVQSNVPPELRGRVMSVYMLCFLGMMPIGSLLGGFCAQAIGEQTTLVIFSVSAFVLMLALATRGKGLRDV